MPKKRGPKYYTKPQSTVHPSLAPSSSRHGGRQTSSDSTDAPPTQVNELLSQLRLSQGPASSAAARLEAVSNLYSTPARGAFLFPPSQHEPAAAAVAAATPRQRMLARARARPLPGPAAPPSWSRGKASLQRSSRDAKDVVASRAHRMDRLPDLELPRRGSLTWICLQKAASEWEEQVEINQEFMSVIPSHLKQALLAMLVEYGPAIVPLSELEFMCFDDSELEGATGVDHIQHVHAGLTADPATARQRGYRGLAAFLFGKAYLQQVNAHAGDEVNSVGGDVPESWEESLETEGELFSVALPQSPQPVAMRFTALKSLSLAHAPHASWRHLLRDLTPHLRNLTHLSLAYWPEPCLTPNARVATVRSPAGELSYGASNYYSQMDGDYRDCVRILNLVGKDLLKLEWLDLEGCSAQGGWVDVFRVEASRSLVDWAGSFRGLKTLLIGQGTTPAEIGTARSKHEFIKNWVTPALIRASWAEGSLAALDNLAEIRSFGMPALNEGEHKDTLLLRVPNIYQWLELEGQAIDASAAIKKARHAKGVAADLQVVCSSRPTWAEGLIGNRRQHSEPTTSQLTMLRRIVPSAEIRDAWSLK